MPPSEGLSAGLARDFWTYAALALDEGALRSLEDACRRAGVRPPGRTSLPGDPGATSFTATLRAAAGTGHRHFLHHAGYYCGASAARHFEGNLRSPEQGARRLVEALAAACPSLQFALESKAGGVTQFAVMSARPVDRTVKEFASGFLRGAAQRLNEGAHPPIAERVLEGGRVWSARVEWGEGQSGEAQSAGARSGGAQSSDARSAGAQSSGPPTLRDGSRRLRR